MVLYEAVTAVLEWVTALLGVHGLKIGLAATAIVLAMYASHIATALRTVGT